jgi:hypothetical protein
MFTIAKHNIVEFNINIFSGDIYVYTSYNHDRLFKKISFLIELNP